MQNLKDVSRRKVLLDLRKKLAELIAEDQMKDPEAPEPDDMGAALEEESLEGETPEVEEVVEEEEPEEENELQSTMKRFMAEPKRPVRKGTAVMIAQASKPVVAKKGKRRDIA